MRKVFLLALISLPIFTANAFATGVNAAASPVLAGSTVFQTTFGSGDVLFKLTQGMPSGCTGFWLRAIDAGFKSNLAALLTSIATGTSIAVSADDSNIWPGSTNLNCLVTGLTM